MHPRIIIAALKGGSGKTILSLGLAAAWRGMGLSVAPFKKGPDFIDAGWLSLATGAPCYNLDPFLMDERQILDSFLRHSDHGQIAVVEGNRGLFDGLDIDGCCSTAEVARLLQAPVLIVLDVTMATRTMAAIVRGCQVFDPELNIAGVILNRVAGPRQKNLITEAIWKYCGIPVVGSVPKLKENPFPERHMGLVPHQESGRAQKAISWAKKTVSDNLQLARIREIANQVPPLDSISSHGAVETYPGNETLHPRIGFIRDQALWFYYPENLSELEKLGAVLVELNAISANALPKLDALYIGGGFPETQAQSLADNGVFRNALKREIEMGLPVYAECGNKSDWEIAITPWSAHYPWILFSRKDPRVTDIPFWKPVTGIPTIQSGKFCAVTNFTIPEPFLRLRKNRFTSLSGYNGVMALTAKKMVYAEKTYWGPIPMCMRPASPIGRKVFLRQRLPTKKWPSPEEVEKEHLTTYKTGIILFRLCAA